MRCAAYGGLAYRKTQSVLAPLCAFFFRHILPAAGIATQFLYRGGQNVAYNRNVMRNASQNFFKILQKGIDKLKY
jgi:hypothetical protein